MTGRLGGMVAAATLVLLLAAGDARAANVHAVTDYNPYCFCGVTSLTITAAPGEGNHATLTYSADPVEVVLDTVVPMIDRPRNLGSTVITDVVPITLSGSGCVLQGPYTARCGSGGPVTGNLGDRNDSLDISGRSNVTFSGGSGDDRLVSTASSNLTGADGDDTVVADGYTRGGNGDDHLRGAYIQSCGAGFDRAVTTRNAPADCETVVERPF